MPLSHLVRRRVCARKDSVREASAEPSAESSEESGSECSSFCRLSQDEAGERERHGWQETLLSMAEKSSGMSRSFLLLYSGYGISCVGDRLWTFAIVFILERLGGMRLVSINQFIEAIAAMLFSTYVGNWMDRHDRKHGTLTVLAINNLSVAISATMLLFCLGLLSGASCWYFPCIALSILFCALSKCASEAERFSFTKDWIVVLAKREGQGQLSARNATLTVIDQLSSVVAPIVTGYCLTSMGYRGACLFFVACNLLFWVLERALLAKVYDDVDELHSREKVHDDLIEKEIELLTHDPGLPIHRRLAQMARAYWRQSVWPAAFGLALLYMTVLGFDGLAISHAKSHGLPDDVIGWFRSAGSALGIAGAFSYTFAERVVGVRKAGVIGMMAQQMFLWMCVISIALPGSPFDPEGYRREITFERWWSQFVTAFSASAPDTPPELLDVANLSSVPGPVLLTSADVDWWGLSLRGHPLTSVVVFLTGLTLARLGLWMADLSITQLMQVHVPEEERGTVFGVQNALCQLFSVLKDVLVIVFPDPRTFGFLIVMSVCFVTLGFASYCLYLVQSRKSVPEELKRQRNNITSQELAPLKPVDCD